MCWLMGACVSDFRLHAKTALTQLWVTAPEAIAGVRWRLWEMTSETDIRYIVRKLISSSLPGFRLNFHLWEWMSHFQSDGAS